MEIVPNDYFDNCESKVGKHHRYYIKVDKDASIVKMMIGDHFVLFDYEDFEFADNNKWRYMKSDKNKTGYIIHSKLMNSFHRSLFSDSEAKDKMIDHINRDGCDNRRCNIRLVSHSENAHNVGLRSTNNSGVTGVFMLKGQNGRSDSWVASIKINNKVHSTNFSINKYGYEKAKELAIHKRKYFENHHEIFIFNSSSQKFEDKPEIKQDLFHELIGIFKIKKEDAFVKWVVEHNYKNITYKTTFNINKYSDNGAKRMAIKAKEIYKRLYSDSSKDVTTPEEKSKNYDNSKFIFETKTECTVKYKLYGPYSSTFSIKEFGVEGARSLCILAKEIFKEIESENNKNGNYVGVVLEKRKLRNDTWTAQVIYNDKNKRHRFSTGVYDNAKELAIAKREEMVEEILREHTQDNGGTH